MQVRMTRRVGFSSGHRYWRSDLGPEENRALFGPWASPYNHGHNYFLEVTVEGEVDPLTGMVVNIKRLDDLLRANIVNVFDGKSINDEVPGFSNHAPTVENLLIHFRETLTGSPQGTSFAVPTTDRADALQDVGLQSLRLEEAPTLFGQFDVPTNAMTLTRTYEFAASHRLHAPGLSAEDNLALFGKCNNPAGHGHNYVLEVTVGGDVNPENGMIVDLTALDEAVEARVLRRYDHKNLDVDVPELQGKITTSEVVATTIFEQLAGHLPARLERVRLFETARNAFEVSRSS